MGGGVGGGEVEEDGKPGEVWVHLNFFWNLNLPTWKSITQKTIENHLNQLQFTHYLKTFYNIQNVVEEGIAQKYDQESNYKRGGHF